MSKIERLRQKEEIIKMRVPNENVSEWMETLRKGGFTDEEINMIMSSLNKEYMKASNPHFVENELEKLKNYFSKEYGRILTVEEIKYLENGIKSRLEED